MKGNAANRLLWRVTWSLLAHWTPPNCMRWRNFLLRAFGARLSPTAEIYGSSFVLVPRNLEMGPFATLGPSTTCLNLAPVCIEEYALVSQGASLCTATYDIDQPSFDLVLKPITIRKSAWIAADAFVGPGVEIGEGAVLGACGVAFSDLGKFAVAVGNPAYVIKSRTLKDG